MQRILRKISADMRKIIVFIVLAVVCAAIFTAEINAADTVYAESDTVTTYESRNVLDDLDGSTIAGVEFDLADYPYDENSKLRLLNLVEFCYSFYTDNQDDYGLYVYVYNPQGLAIDDNSELNQIELSYDGEKSWDKYGLELLNYSTKSGYEGLFYKFKVVFTDTELSTVLNTLSTSSRVYTISGIEISVGGTAPDYEVGATYTYTGYSLGYGSSLATESSLSCTVTGYDRYLTLDVQQTVYYPEGSYYNGDQVQLNSCYFGVPNEYLDDYGTLTNILAEWYEYLTKPILVTEDKDIYNALYSLYGRGLSELSDGNEYLFMSFGNASTILWGLISTSSDSICWTSNDYDNFLEHDGYYVWADGVDDLHMEGDDLSADKFFENFAAVFYTGSSTSYTDYSVSADSLQSRFLLNSQYLAKNGYSLDILDKYCSYLFEDYIDSTGNTTEHVMGYNKLDITSDDIITIYSNSTSKSFWQKAFGGYTVTTDYDDYDALVKVNYSDIKSLADSEISANYFINESDASDFKSYVKTAESNDETVYIMRYGCANYTCMPMAQSCTAQESGMTKTLCVDVLTQWNNSDYSAYVCKETVYLNFDIISLTFTAEDGVETVIPVVSSPTDVFSDTFSPLEEEYGSDSSSWTSILKIILAVILILFLVILLTPILPYIIQGIIFVISIPFKLIAAIIKGIKRSTKSKTKVTDAGNADITDKEVKLE